MKKPAPAEERICVSPLTGLLTVMIKKWTLFVATAGLVLAQVVDPATAQKMAEILAGLIP